jgi:hypothetical protein
VKTRGLFSFGCLVAALSLTAVAFGSSNAAVMTSRGSVALNGKACPTTTALFSGDKVATADGAVVTISSPGSTVLIPSNSQVVFNGGALDLTAGTASISTTKGMAAHLEQYVIAPATGDTAKFEIKKTASSLSIHASSGALTVSSPGKTFALAEGATATATLDSASGRPQDTSPIPAAGTTPVSHKAFWIWNITLAAAAATGLILGIEAISDSDNGAPFCGTSVCNASPPVSPTSPCVCPVH